MLWSWWFELHTVTDVMTLVWTTHSNWCYDLGGLNCFTLCKLGQKFKNSGTTCTRRSLLYSSPTHPHPSLKTGEALQGGLYYTHPPPTPTPPWGLVKHYKEVSTILIPHPPPPLPEDWWSISAHTVIYRSFMKQQQHENVCIVEPDILQSAFYC